MQAEKLLTKAIPQQECELASPPPHLLATESASQRFVSASQGKLPATSRKPGIQWKLGLAPIKNVNPVNRQALIG